MTKTLAMKKSILTTSLIIISIIISSISYSQSISPIDGTVYHNKKSRPCLEVNVDPEAKTLKKAWNNYLKENYSVKLKGIGFLSNKDLLSSKQVIIPVISPNAMDFYTEIIENANGSQMRVFASFGYDIYVDAASMPKEYVQIRKIMDDFLQSYIPNYYQELIKDKEKVVKSLNKDQSKLQKSIKKDTRSVEKMTKELESLNSDITKNKAELEETESKLTNRNQQLNELKTKLNSVN